MPKEVSKQFFPKIKAAVVVLAGAITWTLTMFKSGLYYPSLGTNGPGLAFWGANGHDGIWHIALAESIKRGSLANPVFAGFNLQNYHLGFDFILALLSKITFIPTVNLYFQILPLIISVLIGFLTFKFVVLWQKSENAALWSTFFVYFGGSFAWLIGRGESAFWSQEAISTLINPPFAMSLIFILAGLIMLIKNKTTWAIIFFGLLIEIKIYAGLLLIGGLSCGLIFELVKERRLLKLIQSNVFKIFIGTLTIALVLFLILNRGSASLIIFQPFWFLETLMGLADRLNWPKYYSAMLSYKSGHNFIKGIPAYLTALIIFWIGNAGTRIIKDWKILRWIKNIKSTGFVEVLILSIILAGIFIPMFFLQKGTPWNTIQFFYYSLFFSGILAGVALSEFITKSGLNKLLQYSLSAVFIILTIPTSLLTLKDVYIPTRPPAMIPQKELSALNFLAKQPPGVVLTEPFNETKAKAAVDNPPRPLYLYASAAYVSAFSKHQVFLEDEINLDITGYEWQERRAQILNWYQEKDFYRQEQFLRDNKINYIYWIKYGQSPLDLSRVGLSNIFENDLVTIYKVN